MARNLLTRIVSAVGILLLVLSSARAQEASHAAALKSWEDCLVRETDGLVSAPDTPPSDIATAAVLLCKSEENTVFDVSARSVGDALRAKFVHLRGRDSHREAIVFRVVYIRAHGTAPPGQPPFGANKAGIQVMR